MHSMINKLPNRHAIAYSTRNPNPNPYDAKKNDPFWF